MMPRASLISLLFSLLLARATLLQAHSGPPFPIVSNRMVGAYDISIWSDPDCTDDGTAAGKFWVVLDAAQRGGSIPDGTRAVVSIRPLDRKGPALKGRAEPVDGVASRQFVALLMDHEGPFGVHVVIEGPLGTAQVDSQVDATYDLRPAPFLLAVFLLPFVLVGLLWAKVLRRRRAAAAIRPSESPVGSRARLPMRDQEGQGR
jgi:hypothetical protein